jgi:hypothetical protein
MKYIFAFFILMFLCSCSLKEHGKGNSNHTTPKPEFEGFLDFNLLQVLEQNGSIEIYKLDMTLYAQLSSSKLITGNKSYVINEDSVSVLSKYIGGIFFAPEYDLLVAKCFGENEDGYFQVELGNERRFVKKNSWVKFLKPKEFFKNQLVSVNNYPLYKYPNDSSEIVIKNSEVYAFEVVEFKGHWLRLRILEELHGSISPDTGWLQWIKNDSVQVEIMYAL